MTITKTDSAMEYINSFLNNYKLKTQVEYMRDITQFYLFLHKKNITDMSAKELTTRKDGEPIKKSDVTNYKSYLEELYKERKNPQGTIRRMVYTVRGLFGFLKGEGLDCNPFIFEAKSIKYTPDSYTPLDKEDALRIAEHIKESHIYGKELFAFIIISAITSLRVNALSSMVYEDVDYDKDQELYILTTRRTKEKFSKVKSMPIFPWMYEMLLEFKIENNDRLFPNLTPDNIHDAITNAATTLDIKGRITTHSLRKIAAVYEMKTRGNIQMGMEQLGHNSSEVFIESYAKYSINYKDLAGMRMFTQVDDSIFDNISKEQILEGLKKLNMTAYEQLAYAVIDNKI